MDIVKNAVQQHLSLYSQECVSIFGRLIDRYEEELRDCDTRLECVCEVFDDFRLSLTFMNFPDMANYGPVLSEEDESFMKEPKFLDRAREREILKNLDSYLSSNNIDEDEYDVYERVTSGMVPK